MRNDRHRRALRFRLGALLFVPPALLAWLGPGCAEGAGPPPLQLVAASSLGELAGALADGFEARTGRMVNVRLGASSLLSRQLAMGSPGDVFLSADPTWVDALETLEREEWLGNRLVWVVPTDGPDVRPEDATSMALGGQDVPLGRYAVAALTARGVTLPERVVHGSDARATLAIVASGGVQAGVVYATDAALVPGVRVVEQFRDGVERPVRYVSALLQEEGRGLYEALGEAWVQTLARELGFEVLP
jgi:molybdate transport system substrate-binding protein